jgi:hypothetical protein
MVARLRVLFFKGAGYDLDFGNGMDTRYGHCDEPDKVACCSGDREKRQFLNRQGKYLFRHSYLAKRKTGNTMRR